MDYQYPVSDYTDMYPQTALQVNPVLVGAYWVFIIAWCVLIIVGMWKMFVKAGQPGWAAIIPIYNLYILLKIAQKPGWWLLLYFIPIVNLVVSLIVAFDVAKNFGRSALFGLVCLFLFQPVGVLILGFGKSQYKGKVPTPTSTEKQPETPPTPTPEKPATV